MLNYETVGSELLNVPASHKKSTENVIVNEDWAMVVKITGYSAGIVSGTKVWDLAGTPKTFEAIAQYRGNTGTPSASEIETDAYTVFYRVGDFDSNGTTGFELHTQDAYKASWVCFVGKQP